MRENIWFDTESSIIEDKGIFIEKCFESILKMYFCFLLVIKKIYHQIYSIEHCPIRSINNESEV